MVLSFKELNKFEGLLLQDDSFLKSLRSIEDERSHCVILQSEDCLMLDVFAFSYLKRSIPIFGENLYNRLLSNSFFDVIVLPKGDKVLVEDIQHIGEVAFLTPIELDKKIIIINKAETMNETAQNKLLKLLEDPPASCKFILKCASRFALLPTVLSRSRIVEVLPLNNDLVLNAIPIEASERQKNLILSASLGRLDYIYSILSDESCLLLEDLLFEVLYGLKRSADLAKFSFKCQKFKEMIETLIFYFECVFRDLMFVSVGKISNAYFKHRINDLKALNKEYTLGCALELMKTFQRARLRIKSFGNIVAIIDELLYSILEVKTKWQRL